MEKHLRLVLTFSSLLWVVPGSPALETNEVSHCREALGMHSGSIPDEDITASSAYDLSSVGPHLGRIRTEKRGGAWCPRRVIQKDVYEFIEVDLGEIKQVTLVETQGRFGNGQGQEYTEQYYLEYQRLDNGPWVRYRNRHGQEAFIGNENTYIAELREVKPPIIARRVRFVPFSQHPRTVCMRVELYGCHWKEGILSYSVRQGDKRGNLNLVDKRYDGTELDDGTLVGGLGQLTDGEEGPTNFRIAPIDISQKGFEWVGWKNETGFAKPVEFTFTFDHVREFSEIRFHCNNYFSKDVQVFRKAEIEFSVGGVYYASAPVEFGYMKDLLIEFARPVVVRIPHRIGKYVRIRLYFESRWIMISEIHFQSVLAKGHFSVETSPRPTTKAPPTASPHTTKYVLDKIVYPDIKDNALPTDILIDSDHVIPIISHTNRNKVQNLPDYTHDGGRKKDDRYQYGRERENNKAEMELTNPKEAGSPVGFPEAYIGIIIGMVTAVILIVISIVVFLAVRQQRRQKSGESLDIYEKQNPDLNNYPGARNPIPATKPLVPNYNMFNNSMTVSETDMEDELLQKLNNKHGMIEDDYEQPQCKDEKDQMDSSRGPSPLYVQLPNEPVYNNAMPNITTNPMYTHRSSSTPPIQAPPPPITAPPPPTHAPPPIPPPPTMTSSVMNDDLAVTLSSQGDRLPTEINKEWLKMMDKLGEGQFGEIHLCVISPAEPILAKHPWLTCDRVAVKVLNKNADKRARDNFYREASVLCHLRDPNLAQVVGVCTQSEPLCMVLEYTRHGDLCSFLKSHVLVEEAKPTDANRLSYGCQLYMATQIASGMKYLETLNMVHRDLATRNCLVGDNCVIKISDLGMSRDRYLNDYYNLENHAVLPIRWMSWEAVLLGKFSSKSDVWSFAVTLWEILTMARYQPYTDMGDKAIITNCSHYFQQDHDQTMLQSPEHCPKEIYDLMLECWSRDESMRPAFREVHMFLQRKNMGYDPRDDLGVAMSTKINTA